MTECSGHVKKKKDAQIGYETFGFLSWVHVFYGTISSELPAHYYYFSSFFIRVMPLGSYSVDKIRRGNVVFLQEYKIEYITFRPLIFPHSNNLIMID